MSTGIEKLRLQFPGRPESFYRENERVMKEWGGLKAVPTTAAATALPVAAKKRIRQSAKAEAPSAVGFFKAAGLPPPVTEFRFHPTRRWKFDYAWGPEKMALEVEGGAWTQGRHTRGAGFVEDISKYNSAVLLGWRVVRCTPDALMTAATIELVRQLLHHPP